MPATMASCRYGVVFPNTTLSMAYPFSPANATLYGSPYVIVNPAMLVAGCLPPIAMAFQSYVWNPNVHATGFCVGLLVGLDDVGLRDGFLVGLDDVGLRVGLEDVGLRVGLDDDGFRVGFLVGPDDVGFRVGAADVGLRVGLRDGAADVGLRVGSRVGLRVGAADVGLTVGESVSTRQNITLDNPTH